MVDRGVPFHKIREAAVNPEPFTVRVSPVPPAGVDDGLMLLIISGFEVAGIIVNVALFDTVTLLLTDTAAVPCVAMKAALSVPVNWVELQKIVETGVPFHKMRELVVNPDP